MKVMCHPVISIRSYRARQKNGSQVARIFQARPGRSCKQQQEQNSRNLGTIFLPGLVVLNQSYGTCLKCHCNRGVTVYSVTVNGEICTFGHGQLMQGG